MGFRRYIFVALASFLILIGVQWHLIYNTYVLKDRDFNSAEKQIINDAYGASIPDDKLYPGAGLMIDEVLNTHMASLKQSYLKGSSAFEKYAYLVGSEIVSKLRKNQNMDSVFRQIVRHKNLDPHLRYQLTLEAIEINFDDGKPNQFLLHHLDGKGVWVAGNLSDPKLENRVTHLSVSGRSSYAYRITFNLFADHPNRMFRVAMEMMPTFLLVAVCILILIAINYYSYHHWVKQKTEAELKTDFLNSITHEFNTPITTIAVAGKSLNDDFVANNSASVKHLAAIIGRQAKNLEKHVAQILQLTLINEPSNFKMIDLSKLLRETIEDYQLKLLDNERLTLKLPKNPASVFADEFMLMTILINLIENGFKFNLDKEKLVEVSLISCDEGYLLKVRDQGEGINKQELQKIFDKFYRLPKSQARPGLGLGLYYVKNALDALGWDLKVEPNSDRGMEFTIKVN